MVYPSRKRKAIIMRLSWDSGMVGLDDFVVSDAVNDPKKRESR